MPVKTQMFNATNRYWPMETILNRYHPPPTFKPYFPKIHVSFIHPYSSMPAKSPLLQMVPTNKNLCSLIHQSALIIRSRIKFYSQYPPHSYFLDADTSIYLSTLLQAVLGHARPSDYETTFHTHSVQLTQGPCLYAYEN